jgi:PAS domain S-box-containing protein
MRNNEESYRLLFESNPHPMWVYDRDTLSFLAVNDAAICNYGYSREEFLATTIKDIRPPEDIPALLEKVAQVTTGLNTTSSRHRKKDGTLIDVEIVSHTLTFLGRRAELVLSMDVTERKRADEEHLQLIRAQAARAEAEEARRRFSFLAEASNVLTDSLDYEVTLKSVARLAVPALADHCVIDLTDENGAIRRVEVACADPSRTKLARKLKKYTPDLNNPEAPATKAMRTGKLVFYPEISDAILITAARDDEHLRILRALGSTSLAVAPLVARGRTLGAMIFALAESRRHYETADLWLIEEVAARAALAVDNARLYEEAQEANRTKDEFLATVSHELRTPLTSMLVWSRMLTAGRLDKATSGQGLKSLVSSIKSLSQLVEDLLDISRISTGKLRISTHPVELVPIIEAAIDVVRPAAEANRIEITTELDFGVAPILGDPDRVQQVLWNLLSNAIKFSEAGGDIRVKLEDAISHAKITVSDKGQGIKPEFLPHVFDRFRQADGSDVRKHGGLGLGLALVREIVEMLGGTVEVESSGAGLGSTFAVKLPLVASVPTKKLLTRTQSEAHSNLKTIVGRNV